MPDMSERIDTVFQKFGDDPIHLRKELEKLRAEIRAEMRLETESAQGDTDPALGEELALIDRKLMDINVDPDEFHNKGPATL